MKNRKKLKLFKSLWTTFVSLQLTISPLAFSQSMNLPQQNYNPNNASMIINQTMQGINQSIQASLGQQMNNQLAFQLSADSQFGQDQAFGCTLPSAQPASPQTNVCQGAPGPGENVELLMAQTENFERIFNKNAELYSLALNMGVPKGTSFGLKCLEERKETLDSNLKNMEQNLEALLNQFKNATDNIVNNINNLTALLDGQAGSNKQIDNQAIDFARFVSSPQCNESFQQTFARQIGANNGLRGIRNELEGRKEASDAVINYDFVGIFNSRMGAIRENLRNKGLRGIAGGYSSATAGAEVGADGKVMERAYAKIMSDVQSELSDAQADLQRYIGSSLPEQDKNFISNLATIKATANGTGYGTWYDNYIKSCINKNVSGSASEGSFQYMIDRLTRPGIDNQHLVTSYKAQLKSLTEDSNLSIDQIISEFEKFHSERARKAHPVAVQNASGGYTDPLLFLKEQKTKCVAQYTSNNAFSDPEARGSTISVQAAHSRVKETLASLTDSYKKIGPRIQEQAQKAFLSCEGSSYSKDASTTNGCNQALLNPESPRFCRANSMSCAQSTVGCFNEIDSFVKTKEEERKNSMATLRTTLNSQLQGIVASLKAQHAQMKANPAFSFLDDLKFNEGDLVIPEFSETEKINPDILMAQFDDLIRRNIKTALQERTAEMNQKIAQEIDQRRTAYNQQRGIWLQRAGACSSYYAQLDDAANEEIQNYDDGIAALEKFCAETAVANAFSCGQESLTRVDDALDQISKAYLKNQMVNNRYQSFRMGCSVTDTTTNTDASDATNEAVGFCDEQEVQEAHKMGEIPIAFTLPENDDRIIQKFSINPVILEELTGVTKSELANYLRNPQGNTEVIGKIMQSPNSQHPQVSGTIGTLRNWQLKDVIVGQCTKFRERLQRNLADRGSSKDGESSVVDGRDDIIQKTIKSSTLGDVKILAGAISSGRRTAILSGMGQGSQMPPCTAINNQSPGFGNPYGENLNPYRLPAANGQIINGYPAQYAPQGVGIPQ